MKLIQPTLTVQNTDTAQWLVTLSFDALGDGQRMTFTLLVPRADATQPFAQLQRDVLARAHSLIGDMLAGRGEPTGR